MSADTSRQPAEIPDADDVIVGLARKYKSLMWNGSNPRDALAFVLEEAYQKGAEAEAEQIATAIEVERDALARSYEGLVKAAASTYTRAADIARGGDS